MGNLCVKKKKLSPVKLVVSGVDNAGKTSICKCLNNEVVNDGEVTATVGCNNFNIQVDGWPLTLYDLGGGKSFRDVWASFLADMHGIIFVIDSADRARLTESMAELKKLLNNKYAKRKPILLLANKQDVPEAMSNAELIKNSGLDGILSEAQCMCKVELCSVFDYSSTHLGIARGIMWIHDEVQKQKPELDARIAVEYAEFTAMERQERLDKIVAIKQAAADKELNNGDNNDGRPNSGKKGEFNTNRIQPVCFSKEPQTARLPDKNGHAGKKVSQSMDPGMLVNSQQLGTGDAASQSIDLTDNENSAQTLPKGERRRRKRRPKANQSKPTTAGSVDGGDVPPILVTEDRNHTADEVLTTGRRGEDFKLSSNLISEGDLVLSTRNGQEKQDHEKSEKPTGTLTSTLNDTYTLHKDDDDDGDVSKAGSHLRPKISQSMRSPRHPKSQADEQPEMEGLSRSHQLRASARADLLASSIEKRGYEQPNITDSVQL